MTVAQSPAIEPRSLLMGIALLVTGYQIAPVIGAIVKWLSTDYSVLQVSWARFFFHLLFIAPLVFWRYGFGVFRLPHQILQLVRGAFLLGATIGFFSAVAVLPLAETLAIVFIYPMIVVLLSPFLLGERFGWRRVSAVVAGFAGALMIIRPGFSEVGVGVFAALGCAFSFACYILCTRRLSGSAPPLVTLGYTAIVGCIALSVVMVVGGEGVWRPPDLQGWLLMAGIGFCAATGHFLVIKAYDYAEASLLAPFGYSEMLSTVILGYLIFGDFPDEWSWLGIAIIVASGVFIALRERRKHQARMAVRS